MMSGNATPGCTLSCKGDSHLSVHDRVLTIYTVYTGTIETIKAEEFDVSKFASIYR